MKYGFLALIIIASTLPLTFAEEDAEPSPVLKALQPFRETIEKMILTDGNDDKLPEKLKEFLKQEDLSIEMKQRALLDFLLAYHLERRELEECEKVITEVIAMKSDSEEAKLATLRWAKIQQLETRTH